MNFLRDEAGQGILEYGLILGLIAMIAVGALLVLGNNANGSLGRSGNAISGSAGAFSGTH